MSENIFEHTTSIVGLTCKPLSILSETISPQEMNMARGGDHHIHEPPETGPPPGMECPPGCQDYCCDPRDIVITNPNPEGPQNLLPPLGNPSPPSGSIFTLIFGGGGSNSAPADSSDSVDTSASADSSSSGTQDQNGGALDNVEEEDDYDWIDPDDEEDWEDFIDEWDPEEGTSGYEGVDTPEEIFYSP